ncbi:hypothetical protein ONZ45_g18373 [Pleurotus djamor]|nr:hypothetical protein ONZ45_g18373 [Pleurotus djamor]
MATEPLPPTVQEILSDRNIVRRRYPSGVTTWRTSKQSSGIVSSLLGKPRPDTPVASFYRLYELFVADDNDQFRSELEYFCVTNTGWRVSDLPDPCDTDPLRYAILAVMTKFMCEAFNRRVDIGLPRDAPPVVLDFEELSSRPRVYEKPPTWAERVPPLKELFYLPDGGGKTIPEGHQYMSAELRKFNIIGQHPHLHFV